MSRLRHFPAKSEADLSVAVLAEADCHYAGTSNNVYREPINFDRDPYPHIQCMPVSGYRLPCMWAALRRKRKD